MMSSLRTILPLVALLLSGFATAADPVERQMQRTELFFTAIDLPAWERFLAEVVTPAFPDGLTWLDVHGQWRGPSGQPEQLPSRLVIILHAPTAGNTAALNRVGREFQTRFGYAVLRSSQAVVASDPDWTDERVRDNQQLAPQSAAH